jgi:regulator of sigma E protease
MFGDADPSSFGPDEEAKDFTEEEKKIAFFTQSLPRRFAIVAAGPAMNYLFGFVVLAILYMLSGQLYTDTLVNEVVAGSVAEKSGLLVGDRILKVDGKTTERFDDIKRIISFNSGTPVEIVFEREGKEKSIVITPELSHAVDRFGGEHLQGKLGIVSTEITHRDLGPIDSFYEAGREIAGMTVGTLKGVGQIIMGVRGAEELGGPLRIAEMSGKVVQDGLAAFIWFIVVISVNLGLVNLFPIPLLDGGHLAFYLAEALRGKPLSERAQEYGARFGALIVVSLMLFATWNDLVHLQVVSYIRGFFS